nr:polyketide synthase dehydratase domain-containing protein [Micromonospora sp. DSM 115978]
MDSTGHPVLGATVEYADSGARIFTGRLALRRLPWLADHTVLGATLCPGAAQLEWALRAADECGCELEEIVLQTPLVVPDSTDLVVQVVVGAADGDGRRDVGVYSRVDAGWTCHATGTLGPVSRDRDGARAGSWPPADAEPVDLSGFYERTAAAGYGYGPAFQGLRRVWRRGRDVLAEVELGEETVQDRDGYGIHPALLDGALHPLLLVGQFSDGQVWLPFSWSGVALHAVGAASIRVTLSPLGEGLDQGVRLVVTDQLGDPVLEVDSVVLRQADDRHLRAGVPAGSDGLYAVELVPVPVPVPVAVSVSGLGSGGGVGDGFVVVEVGSVGEVLGCVG